ncbi:MAG: hypothetical protein AB9866_06685 [Syntrophobacteraceae bacterium]
MIYRFFGSFCLLLAGVFLFHASSAAAPVMVEKNLFAQDRKPPSPESAAPSQPTKPGMAIANIQLDGVMIQGNSKKALIRLKNVGGGGGPGKQQKGASTPFVTVREGQQVGDFRVSKIEPKSISFEKEGQTYTIGLFAENKVVSPAAPVPPAPPPPPMPAPGQPPQPQRVPGDQHPGFVNVPNQPGAVVPQPPAAQNRQNMQQPPAAQMMPEPDPQEQEAGEEEQ